MTQAICLNDDGVFLPTHPRKVLKIARKCIKKIIKDDRYILIQHVRYYVENTWPGDPISVNVNGAIIAKYFKAPRSRQQISFTLSNDDEQILSAVQQIELGNIDFFFSMLGRKVPTGIDKVMKPIYYRFDNKKGCKELLKRFDMLIDALKK